MKKFWDKLDLNDGRICFVKYVSIYNIIILDHMLVILHDCEGMPSVIVKIIVDVITSSTMAIVTTNFVNIS